MGAEDMRRQHPNVERMRLLGAEVESVEFGTKTLKEATSEAIRDWIANVETTYYLIGSCVGPAPYPSIVRELQAVIGREARTQMLETYDRLPTRSSHASAAARTRSGSSPGSSTTRTCASSASRPRERRASARAGRPCSTARARPCSPTPTGRCSTRIRSPPGSTTRASGRSTRRCATPAARST